jgi:hypothetical protein
MAVVGLRPVSTRQFIQELVWPLLWTLLPSPSLPWVLLQSGDTRSGGMASRERRLVPQVAADTPHALLVRRRVDHIRLGKYEYPLTRFPAYLRVDSAMFGFATPGIRDWIGTHLVKLIRPGEGPPWIFDPSCRAEAYSIPSPWWRLKPRSCSASFSWLCRY